MPKALTALELGGIYLPFGDTSKGSPFYAVGGIAGADGQFDVVVPGGRARSASTRFTTG
jgi:hypothetical protein